MKRIVFLFLSVFMIGCKLDRTTKFNYIDQSDSIAKFLPITELDTIPNEFYKRWKLDAAAINDTRIGQLPKSPMEDYLFKEDGTYYLYDSENEYITGTWAYNSAEKVIYLKRNHGEVFSKIVSIDSTQLILIPAGKFVENSAFEQTKFYYIPSE